MPGEITQIPQEQWPTQTNSHILTDEVAGFCLLPQEISARSGIIFTHDLDDSDGLGKYCAAVVLCDHHLYALISYMHSTVKGTALVMESGLFDPRKGLSQLRGILNALQIPPEEIVYLKEKDDLFT
ncbi:MAG: hypothetical protein ACAI35_11070 [Candidatus Methylacidiphilales bacterium]|nr:hypothetical protein [Candidatus Methylacidiphilales bacterium]